MDRLTNPTRSTIMNSVPHIIIVYPVFPALDKSDAVQMWRAGRPFQVLVDEMHKLTYCNNQNYPAGEEIEIRYEYPKSFTNSVIIHN